MIARNTGPKRKKFPLGGVGNQFVVTSTADSDDGTCDSNCTLREAIAAANAAPGEDTITFQIPANDPGCTAANQCIIGLGTTLPAVSDNLGIDGTVNNEIGRASCRERV